MPEHKSSDPILKELNAIMNMIAKAESIEQLPAIERDIVLSKLRQIYDQLSDVSHQNEETGNQSEPEPEIAISEQEDVNSDTLEFDETSEPFADQPSMEIPEEPEHEIIPDETEKQFADRTTDEIPDEPEEPVAEQPAAEIYEEPVEENKVEEDEKIPEDKPVENGFNSQPGIIAEKLTGEKQFVYDTLTEKSSRDNISTKLQSKPITDIAAAIGINDKFQLIRDLFNGDSGSFNKTLETLNGATNFNEAFTYINEKFDWDMEDPSVQLILELVRRKFIVKKDE